MQVIHLRESHRIFLRKWRHDSEKRWWPIKEHCYPSVDSGWLELNNQKAMLANPGLLRVVPFTPLPRELGSYLKSSHESSIRLLVGYEFLRTCCLLSRDRWPSGGWEKTLLEAFMVPITMTEDKQSRGYLQDRPQFPSRFYP